MAIKDRLAAIWQGTQDTLEAARSAVDTWFKSQANIHPLLRKAPPRELADLVLPPKPNRAHRRAFLHAFRQTKTGWEPKRRGAGYTKRRRMDHKPLSPAECLSALQAAQIAIHEYFTAEPIVGAVV